MKRDVINFKVERSLKKKSQKKATALGLSLSSVLNTYLRKFLRTSAVDYVDEEAEMLEPTPYLKRLLKQSEKDVKEGYVSPAFNNFADLDAWLENPDAR